MAGSPKSGARLRELGAFLRDRRTRLEPAAVGISADGVRKTAGLRREELCDIAGVSVGYYVRLEQGRGGPPSASVVDALARALRLTADEQAYLHSLADISDNRYPVAATPEMIRAAQDIVDLVAAPSVAYVIDRSGDVLAWNAGAAALFVDHLLPDTRPNNVRYVFCNPVSRELFADWDEIADDAVAHLRATIGQRPDDPAVRAFVSELSNASNEFADRWQRRDVWPCTAGAKTFNHPVAGRLRLTYRVLDIPETCHHRLVVYRAEPGSADHEALTRLESDR
ncbi:helix-turn-helix transcriptional regulator [Fodinicola acaciae]|uniref:helix-turn-helix transcriptional regulator n=1 Tax=Fodinicola acaciae TaxID=2681555 RepID=UPI0013D85A40|nr:helix-turn-helix transcriptional regulator [Fodinicola acaciae]